ncbi:MAG TPA: cytochrome c [Pelomicrobium sp.]|nr:cytochrome c [Pelomicrobium sp.]
MRKRIAIAGAASAIAAAGALAFVLWPAKPSPEQIARGKALYDQHCAACHGANLEGEPNWRVRKPSGRMPAPPHDDTGHTWHHPDEVLFGITKYGVTPPYGPPGYQSDMPAFKDKLSDDQIRAVLAYIESTWSPQVIAHRQEMLANRRR